jgi:hypothetical protein
MRRTILGFPIKPGENPGAEGYVTSVTTGMAVPHAHVFFKKDGKIAKAAQTDAAGKYWTPLPDGKYEVYAKKNGFVGVTQHLQISDGRKRYLDPIISRKLGRNQARFVLTWSHSPDALDSYLLTPSGCIVWSANRECPGALMDTESGGHRGPQTITITDTTKGRFVFFAKQQSKHGALAATRAVARLFTDESSVRVFHVGTDGKVAGPHGQGRGWIVASIANGAVRSGRSESSDLLSRATPAALHRNLNKKRLHKVYQLLHRAPSSSSE